MSNISIAKKRLREQMRMAISRLSQLEKEDESETMVVRIAEFISNYPMVKTVASYAATSAELNLDKLPSRLTELSFCYPKCSTEGIMDFYEIGDLSEMKPKTMGIREPDPKIHKRITAESIDLFICPAFAYSTYGKRLGKGGGYYDRYLCTKRSDALTFGVVFSCQKVDADLIPTEAHDLLIDHVL